MNRKILLLISCFFICVSGCVQTEIIDELMIVSMLGYEPENDTEMRITLMAPFFQKNGPVKNVILSNVTNKDDHTIGSLQEQSNNHFALGSLMITLFDKQLAEKTGIIEHLTYLKRDPNIGSTLYLAIVDGDVKELISGNYGQRGNAQYVRGLINHNISYHDLPETNLHLFLFNYYQRGKDATLPILKQMTKDRLKIDGLALFKDDKIVATIPNEKLFYVKLLIDKHTDGMMQSYSSGKDIVFKSVKSKMKMKLTQRNPYIIRIDAEIEGSLRDYKKQILNKKEIEKAEKFIQLKIEKETKKIIQHMQELGADPVGFGAFVKSKTRKFDFDAWAEEYPSVQVDVQVGVTILDTGTLE